MFAGVLLIGLVRKSYVESGKKARRMPDGFPQDVAGESFSPILFAFVGSWQGFLFPEASQLTWCYHDARSPGFYPYARFLKDWRVRADSNRGHLLQGATLICPLSDGFFENVWMHVWEGLRSRAKPRFAYLTVLQNWFHRPSRRTTQQFELRLPFLPCFPSLISCFSA